MVRPCGTRLPALLPPSTLDQVIEAPQAQETVQHFPAGVSDMLHIFKRLRVRLVGREKDGRELGLGQRLRDLVPSLERPARTCTSWTHLR